MPQVRVLHCDDDLVAVDKPAGLLTHRAAMARDRDYALQQTRDRIGRRVYAVHRLDRAASGVLLFALNRDAGRDLSRLFEDGRVTKRYIAVTRGWLEETGAIDYPLQDSEGPTRRPALTRYRTLARTELPYAVGRYPSSRYSLLEVCPRTGRFHQIRRHFHHIYHPLIGDTTHGEGRHNRFFREAFGVQRLLLHAQALCVVHPRTGLELCIRAPLDEEWTRLLARLGWSTVAEAETL
jgi:tRNA pseudouridine65 synthase